MTEHTADYDAAIWDEAVAEVERLIRSGETGWTACWAAREANPYRVTQPDGSTDV